MLDNHLLRVHFSCSRIATSQAAYDRFYDVIAIALQLCQIVLQDGILPHAGIHGRSYQLWCLGGQHGSGEHIVADAVSQFADDIGCTGSHYEEIASLGQRYMFHIEREVAVEGIDNALVVGECLERHGGNEVGGILGHDDMHFGMELDQHRSQIGALIGCYTACNTQYDGLSCKHLLFGDLTILPFYCSFSSPCFS